MIATLESVRVFARTAREARAGDAALVGASAALDAIAAAILLGASTTPAQVAAIEFVVAHAIATLLPLLVTDARPSRLLLCFAATLAVPGAGTAVAITALATKGRAHPRPSRRKTGDRKRKLSVAEIERLATALSPCDALDRGDEEERREALAALSRDGGPAAIALLRQTTAHPDPDVALSAALVLDELSARAERGSAPAGAKEARHAER